jgi:dTDP-4-dehydrorhamnose 3,5-epimerase-like enzyme
MMTFWLEIMNTFTAQFSMHFSAYNAVSSSASITVIKGLHCERHRPHCDLQSAIDGTCHQVLSVSQRYASMNCAVD